MIIVGGATQIQVSFGTTQEKITVLYTKKGKQQMSNIYTIHPQKSELILLYEVVDEQGRGLWGGADSLEAIKWLRLNLRDKARLLVSAWDSDEEDAHLVGQSIDITGIVLDAFKEGLKV